MDVLNYVHYMLTRSTELARYHLAKKLANCTHSMTSDSHSGGNLQSESESMSKRLWKMTSHEADDLYILNP